MQRIFSNASILSKSNLDIPYSLTFGFSQLRKIVYLLLFFQKEMHRTKILDAKLVFRHFSYSIQWLIPLKSG